MTDSDALLATILAHPDDDLPRLVFADYLEESGDAPRAEFIRVQCELARLSIDDPERAALVIREAELLEEHRPKWTIPDLRGVQYFHRGFVDGFWTSAQRYIESAERIHAATPLHKLRISNLADHLNAFTQVPQLSRIRALDLTVNNFAGGLHLERLLGEAALDSLVSLTIHNAVLWPNAVEILANAPVASQFTHLDLSGNPIADAGVQTMAQSASFANLRELVLRNDEIQFHDSIHATGVTALAQSTTLTKLRLLDLDSQYIGDAGLIALAGSRNAAALELLDVSFNEIGATGERSIETLVESANLANLKRLALRGNPLNRLAIQALAAWPRLAEGLIVDLREAELDPRSRSAILTSPFADRFLLDS